MLECDTLELLVSLLEERFEQMNAVAPLTVQDFFHQVPEDEKGAGDLSKKVLELVPAARYIRYMPGQGLRTMLIDVVETVIAPDATSIRDAFVVRCYANRDGEREYETMTLSELVRPRIRGGSREPGFWRYCPTPRKKLYLATSQIIN